MKRSRTHQLRLATEISITPLLDLAFILLFAFIVAAPLIADKDLLSLPVGTASPATESPETITVLTLLATDDFEWDGDLLSAADLQSRAAQAVAENPDVGVVVQLGRCCGSISTTTPSVVY